MSHIIEEYYFGHNFDLDKEYILWYYEKYHSDTTLQEYITIELSMLLSINKHQAFVQKLPKLERYYVMYRQFPFNQGPGVSNNWSAF